VREERNREDGCVCKSVDGRSVGEQLIPCLIVKGCSKMVEIIKDLLQSLVQVILALFEEIYQQRNSKHTKLSLQ
jgi:hypothetical protein